MAIARPARRVPGWAGSTTYRRNFADLLQVQLRSIAGAILDCGFVPALIPARDEAAGDDLRLDLGGALEDVQDAGVAQHPADRIFEGVAVAAVDLQGVVGVRPGDPCGKQLGHAGLDVAAPAAVFFARREVSQ